MFCPACGKQLPEDSRFCLACGKKLATASDVKRAYMRLKDAAVYCGMSTSLLMKRHAMGEGPPRIKKGRCVLYSVKALDAWMEEGTEPEHYRASM